MIEQNGNEQSSNYASQNDSIIQEPISSPIGHEVVLFIRHIDSLAHTGPLMMSAITEAQKAAIEKFNEFIEEYCEIVVEDDTERKFSVQLDHLGQLYAVMRELDRPALARKIIPRSFLVTLVSEYDAFLSRLIRCVFLILPETLNASEKNITFSELLRFGSIETAREYIIEKEIETVLRKSHSEQFDWLESKFGLALRKGLDIWPNFVEVTERRNLFVHNNGNISSQYLHVCNKHGVETTSKLNLGDELYINREYFDDAYLCIFEVGVKLAHVLWRKVHPESREQADNNLITVCYDLLREGKYAFACKLLDFAVSLKKYSSEEKRRVMVVNRAQAYKWIGQSGVANETITDEDWTATSDKFKLAEAIILDDFDKADQIVRRIGSDGEVQKSEYREWPLFQEYRKSARFAEIFEEIFHEPLNLVSIKEPPSEPPNDQLES